MKRESKNKRMLYDTTICVQPHNIELQMTWFWNVFFFFRKPLNVFNFLFIWLKYILCNRRVGGGVSSQTKYWQIINNDIIAIIVTIWILKNQFIIVFLPKIYNEFSTKYHFIALICVITRNNTQSIQIFILFKRSLLWWCKPHIRAWT